MFPERGAPAPGRTGSRYHGRRDRLGRGRGGEMKPIEVRYGDDDWFAVYPDGDHVGLDSHQNIDDQTRFTPHALMPETAQGLSDALYDVVAHVQHGPIAHYP